MEYQYLIDQMSLQEKASLLSGEDYWNTKPIERLNIPSINMSDGPHGVRKQAGKADNLGLHTSIPATCYPTAATLANSWDRELVYNVGKELGEEAKGQQVNVLLGPGLNIKRNPLGGRNFEYFSEDPYLTGELASNMVKGMQLNNIGACPKHFAVNSQETLRMTMNEVVDERALNEIYLFAFEKTVKESNPKMIMGSYNRINGEYANENTHLMNDILHDSWQYDGVTVTDWGANSDRVAGLKAHNQLEMPSSGGVTDKEVVQAVLNGEIQEQLVDEAVNQLLKLIFDVEQKNKKSSFHFINYMQHHLDAIDAAQQSMVLLKNENNILPLKPKTKVAIIGDFAKNPRYQGGGSSFVNPYYLDNALELLQYSNLDVVGYAQGFLRMGEPSERRVHEAISLARKADVVLLFLGLDESNEAEAVDRPSLSLNKNQLNLVQKLRFLKKDTVTILAGGGPIEMPFARDMQGIIHTYLTGQGGAQALCNVLLGRYNPSGKLSETLPICYEDIPTKNYYPGKEATAEHRESIFVGYRYFDTADKPVLFPFGYGLSYTKFSYSNVKQTSNQISFTLKNVGECAGAEIVQLYFKKDDSAIFRAKKQLINFEKVFLNPGEEKEVTFTFCAQDFAFYSTKNKAWQTEAGKYTLQIARSSRHIELEAVVEIKGIEQYTEYLKSDYPNYAKAMVENIPDSEFEKLLGYAPPNIHWNQSLPLTSADAILQMRYKNWLGKGTYYTMIGVYNLLKMLNKPLIANGIYFTLNMRFNQIGSFTDQLISPKIIDTFIKLINK